MIEVSDRVEEEVLVKIENKFSQAHVAAQLSIAYEYEEAIYYFRDVRFQLRDRNLHADEGSTVHRMWTIGNDTFFFTINQKIYGPFNLIEVKSDAPKKIKIVSIIIRSWEPCPLVSAS